MAKQQEHFYASMREVLSAKSQDPWKTIAKPTVTAVPLTKQGVEPRESWGLPAASLALGSVKDFLSAVTKQDA